MGRLRVVVDEWCAGSEWPLPADIGEKLLLLVAAAVRNNERDTMACSGTTTDTPERDPQQWTLVTRAKKK
jgi:hypothetical protein